MVFDIEFCVSGVGICSSPNICFSIALLFAFYLCYFRLVISLVTFGCGETLVLPISWSSNSLINCLAAPYSYENRVRFARISYRAALSYWLV